eukprot:6170618-Lingulodinium_polyedra.AAC.1
MSAGPGCTRPGRAGPIAAPMLIATPMPPMPGSQRLSQRFETRPGSDRTEIDGLDRGPDRRIDGIRSHRD